MTTTVPAQAQTAAGADDLQIIQTPPTIADAQLIVQLQMAGSISGADQGWMLLQAFESPPTMSQVKKRHPMGSPEWGQIYAFLASCETMATFVKNGLLNEALVGDVFWITGAWQKAEKICKAMRKEAGEPRLMENIEWLAKRAT
jgi:hypothetical protein